MNITKLTLLLLVSFTQISFTQTVSAQTESIHHLAKGMVNIQSAHSVEITTNRLESVLKQKGMTIFNRINHAKNGVGVGLFINPTELIIFGNPKIGTPLMQCTVSVAIDLPQKALIWQDKQGQVWLSYNDPHHLKQRHQISGCDPVLAKVAKALENFAKFATSK